MYDVEDIGSEDSSDLHDFAYFEPDGPCALPPPLRTLPLP